MAPAQENEPSGRPRQLIEGVGLAIGEHDGVATVSDVVPLEPPALLPLPIGRTYPVSLPGDMSFVLCHERSRRDTSQCVGPNVGSYQRSLDQALNRLHIQRCDFRRAPRLQVDPFGTCRGASPVLKLPP